MRTDRLQISALIWPRDDAFFSLELQHQNLWRVAKELESLGIPLDQWFPPAETETESTLNRAFDQSGPTPAALALARSYKSEALNYYGAWNASEDDDGLMFKVEIPEAKGPFPAMFELAANKAVSAFDKAESVVRVVREILDIWSPVLVEIGPYGYHKHQAFPDKPGVGWMVYLPFAIKRDQVPEAAEVIPVLGDDKKQKGAIVVSTQETFDVENKAHIKLANAIEIRLVDQDLLPRRADFRNIR